MKASTAAKVVLIALESVKEIFRDKTVCVGTVRVFDLDGIPSVLERTRGRALLGGEMNKCYLVDHRDDTGKLLVVVAASENDAKQFGTVLKEVPSGEVARCLPKVNLNTLGAYEVAVIEVRQVPV